ncbi:Uncharacterised protein [Mycobacteroides abscessus subsp. massiliense]|nr:Uncharacterised protein [Mycobacteroides abscessus subsp. massiliense]
MEKVVGQRFPAVGNNDQEICLLARIQVAEGILTVQCARPGQCGGEQQLGRVQGHRGRARFGHVDLEAVVQHAGQQPFVTAAHIGAQRDIDAAGHGPAPGHGARTQE